MNRVSRPSLRAVVVAISVGLVGAIAWAAGRGRAAARAVPISPVTADGVVGAEFVDREGLSTGDPVAGELDDLSSLASDGFDPAELDPPVREFYERTAEYDLRYRATWHPPFRTGAAIASRLTSRIQQLNLPGPDDESWHDLESRFVAVEEPNIDEPGVPEREDVRAWVRTDPDTGEAVFVALYATHERGGERLVNIAVPVPAGNVSTVLRPELVDADEDRPTGVRFTTEGGGDAGLYLRTPFGPVRLPAGQLFEVWSRPDGTLGAVHEMWLLGRPFLTVDYEMVAPADVEKDPEREDKHAEPTAEN